MVQKELQTYIDKGLKVGKNCQFISPGPNFGSEPYLIEIGDNTTVSFDVAFVNHEGGTRVLRRLAETEEEKQTIIYGKIVIGKNCFIGCRATILPGVEIGDNTIIGAGSVVNRDIPANCVAAGVPCKVICTLDEYKEKHKDDFLYMVNLPYEEKKKFLLRHFDDKNKDGKV